MVKTIIVVASVTAGCRAFWTYGDSEWEAWLNGANNALNNIPRREQIEVEDDYLKIQGIESCFLVLNVNLINPNNREEDALKKSVGYLAPNESSEIELYVHGGDYAILQTMIRNKKIKEGNAYTTRFPNSNLFETVVTLINALNTNGYDSFCQLSGFIGIHKLI